jgi:hypothetical protein
VDLTVSSGGPGPFVQLSRAGRSLSLSWPAPLPSPTVSGDTLTYADVLPGVDLRVVARVDGFSEDIVVNSAAAAANPAVRSLVLGTSSSGLSVDAARDASGGLEATDGSGVPVFTAAQPRMWDAGGAGPSGEAAQAADAG